MTLPVDPARYSAFLVAMAVMALTPGPANIFSLRTGLAGRHLAVLAGVAGLNCGTVIWFFGAALGLDVISRNLPWLFDLMGLCGGLYLLWIAFQTLKTAHHLGAHSLDMTPGEANTDWLQSFRQGLMVQLLNPKALLFFIAVLPPFLALDKPMAPQLVMFAMTTLSMDIITMTAYGLAAVTLSHYLSRPLWRQRFEMGVGAILGLIALAVILHAAQGVLN